MVTALVRGQRDPKEALTGDRLEALFVELSPTAIDLFGRDPSAFELAQQSLLLLFRALDVDIHPGVDIYGGDRNGLATFVADCVFRRAYQKQEDKQTHDCRCDPTKQLEQEYPPKHDNIFTAAKAASGRELGGMRRQALLDSSPRYAVRSFCSA